jgi:hypothetical protein
LKILIVNSYDKGGAANACLRLHQGLLDRGVNSKVLLKEQQNPAIPHTYVCPPKIEKPSKIKVLITKFTSLLDKLHRISSQPHRSKEDLFLKNRAKGLELFSFPTSHYDITTTQLYKEADIIHLHWVADFLDYKTFW